MVFAYTHNVTVVSRVSQQVVYNVSLGESIQVRDISFDLLMGRVLLGTKDAPVLISTLENEAVDAWRQFLAKGEIQEAYKYH